MYGEEFEERRLLRQICASRDRIMQAWTAIIDIGKEDGTNVDTAYAAGDMLYGRTYLR